METFSVSTRERVDLVDMTSQVEQEVAKSSVGSGTVTIYIPHTTCGVTINESADPDVARDIKMHLTSWFRKTVISDIMKGIPTAISKPV